jgi:hypothetical protein
VLEALQRLANLGVTKRSAEEVSRISSVFGVRQFKHVFQLGYVLVSRKAADLVAQWLFLFLCTSNASTRLK